MAFTIRHECGTHAGLLADVRIAELAAWDVHLQHAENNSGTLTFSLRADNPELYAVNVLVSEVSVMDGVAELWRGRVTKLERTDAGRSTVTAMGMLDYLHDTITPALEISGTARATLAELLSSHNAKLPLGKRFYTGTITLEETVTLETNGRRETWQELSSLVKKYGGYIFARRENGFNYLDWLDSVTNVCSRVLESGASISSLKLSVDPSELVTVLYAYGGNVDGVTVDMTSVNNGNPYITDQEAHETFGRIEGCYQDSGIKDASALKSAAQKELKRRIDAARSVRVTALDRADLFSMDEMTIGSRVRVRAPRLGIDELMPIKELDWYPYEPTKTTLVCCASLKAISRIF